MGVWWENWRQGDHLEVQGVDGIIISQTIRMGGRGLDSAGSGYRQMTGCYERGNVRSCSVIRSIYLG